MNKLLSIPIIILIIQIISFIHLYMTYKKENAHVPEAFIELNILAILNVIVLIIAYFLFYKVDVKIVFWWIPIFLSVSTITLLLILYIRMWLGNF